MYVSSYRADITFISKLEMDLIQYLNETDGLEDSMNFAMKYGLLPDRSPKNCLRCGNEKSLRCTKNSRRTDIPYNFVCCQKGCRWTVSMSRNTLFDRLNFPLSYGLRLIYFWLLKISTKDSSDQFKLPEMIVTEYYKFFRQVCAFMIINYTQPIGGPGHSIELCEFHLQTKEESHDVWMITGIDRNTGENFAVHLEVLDSETLWPVIKNYILPGSVIITERHKEFTKKEKEAENPSLKFAHISKSPRTEEDYHLDAMWNALVEYVEKEIPPNETVVCKELYAYQFLYFNRDGFCEKPASELILPFISDVKQVYPGFEKDRHLEIKKPLKKM